MIEPDLLMGKLSSETQRPISEVMHPISERTESWTNSALLSHFPLCHTTPHSRIYILLISLWSLLTQTVSLTAQPYTMWPTFRRIPKQAFPVFREHFSLTISPLDFCWKVQRSATAPGVTFWNPTSLREANRNIKAAMPMKDRGLNWQPPSGSPSV